MGITRTFSSPFFSGAGRSSKVPWTYPVAIDGHAYMVDWASDLYRHESLPAVREQADDSTEPGEQTIARGGLWRRSRSSWHRGAGQTYLDREDSDPYRFRSSKGVDPWGRWELSLLNDTEELWSTSATNLRMCVAGGRLYFADGLTLRFTQNFTDLYEGSTPNTILSLASDGYTVYTAHGASGIYSSIAGSGTSTSYNTIDATLLGYVLGRLMAADGNVLYNVTSTTPPSALFTHDNADFEWVGFAAGKSAIYAAGYSGDKSLIYRIGIKDDGTGLDVPIPAAQLPDGEIVRSIDAYLGFVLIGTDKGVRFAVADQSGNLELGALIETDAAVYCFEGQDRFVWFGWSNYDDTSTGLGRLNLREINDGLAPAYASDLMASNEGAVQAVATLNDRRVFSVSGEGYYLESPDPVPSGTLDTGLISYGVSDDKIAVKLDLRHQPLDGAVAAYLSVDAGPFVYLGSSIITGSQGTTLLTREERGETFELRLELSDGTTFTRWTLRSLVAATTGAVVDVPLLFETTLEDLDEVEHDFDPVDELDHIKGLHESKRIVTFQEGATSFPVTVEDYRWMPRAGTQDRSGHVGTLLVRLKTID